MTGYGLYDRPRQLAYLLVEIANRKRPGLRRGGLQLPDPSLA